MNSPKICVPIVSRVQDISPVEPLADFFEVRIDLIGEGWKDIAGALKKPWIACNRRREDGGKWGGDEGKRVRELLSALDMGASVIDLELGAPVAEAVVGDIKGKADVIISYHNFQETPPEDRLRQIIINQLAAGADICKIVTTARTAQDNLQVLKLIPAFPDVKIICFAMGIIGQVSRVMSPLVGGYLTWAAAQAGSESASGQMAAGDLRQIYKMIGDK